MITVRNSIPTDMWVDATVDAIGIGSEQMQYKCEHCNCMATESLPYIWIRFVSNGNETVIHNNMDQTLNAILSKIGVPNGQFISTFLDDLEKMNVDEKPKVRIFIKDRFVTLE